MNLRYWNARTLEFRFGVRASLRRNWGCSGSRAHLRSLFGRLPDPTASGNFGYMWNQESTLILLSYLMTSSDSIGNSRLASFFNSRGVGPAGVGTSISWA
jgi:hypothetical protein